MVLQIATSLSYWKELELWPLEDNMMTFDGRAVEKVNKINCLLYQAVLTE